MRLLPETSSLGRWLALLPVTLAVGVLVFARLAPQRLLAAAHCPLRDLTGLACPTCGGTHAVVALAGGHWSEAWRLNPAVPVGALLIAAWAAWAAAASLAPALRVRPVLERREKTAATWLAAVALLALWIRQIWALP
jgi:hypothetical protein